MNNSGNLSQARKGIEYQIAQSPQILTITRLTPVSDGFGGYIPGTVAVSPAQVIKARVSHERRGVQDKGSAPNGLDTNLSLWILTRWDSGLIEGDKIIVNSRAYRVGVTDKLTKFGGVIAIQAPLIEG